MKSTLKVVLDNKAIIARLREACGVRRDADLADYLGVTSSTLASWKKNVGPPFDACYEVSNRTGVCIKWLLNGDEPSSVQISSKDIENINQTAFVNNYVEGIQYGISTRLITLAEDAEEIELRRMGAKLFYDTFGKLAIKEEEVSDN